MNKKPVPANYKHQDVAHDYIKEKDFFALFMDQGTGKSKTALNKCALLYEQGKINGANIIAPKQLINQWINEVIPEHWPYDYKAFAWKGFTTKKEVREYKNFLNYTGFKFFALNYDTFQGTGLKKIADKDLAPTLAKLKIYSVLKEFFSTTKAMVILDESTKIKEPKASQTRSMLYLYSKQVYKAILTGTPTPNSPIDLFTQFGFLKSGFWGMPYFIFENLYSVKITIRDAQTNRQKNIPISEKYWNAVKTGWKNFVSKKALAPDEAAYDYFANHWHIAVKDLKYILSCDSFQPFKNIDKIKTKIAPYTFFCKKEDCLDLPKKIYQTITGELSAEQKRLIKELKNNWLTELEGKELSVENSLSLISRIQLIRSGFFPDKNFRVDSEGNEKVYFVPVPLKENPALDVLISDIGLYAFSTPVIIWGNFTCEVDSIYAKLISLKKIAAKLYGQTNDNERIKIEADFKAGKIDFLVMNPAIGEYGFNFQICNFHYFFSNTYKADRRLQAEDRSHRIGLKNNVLYKDIIMENTLDRTIQNVIQRKSSMIDFFKTRAFVEAVKKL